nr:unnamed protein product [Spirometra erinaceieuropaei]
MLLPPVDAVEGDVDAPQIVALAAQCTLYIRTPRHLQDKATSATSRKTTCNQLTRRLKDQQALDKNASVETRWCQLRVGVHAIALGVLDNARRQCRSLFNENDAAVSCQLAEENKLGRAYIDRASDANKGAF